MRKLWNEDGPTPGSAEWHRIQAGINDVMRHISRSPHIPTSASMIPPSKERPEPVKPGNGWVDAAPLVRPRGVGWGETPEDKHAREARERERVQQQQERENAEIEARLAGDDGPKIEHEYNPFSRRWMSR